MNYKHVLHLVVLLLATQSSMADTFPYRATVRVQDAPVRSGPGNDFYPTSKLSRGQVVDVYRHKNDEWCAIRPPEGSFSWVLAGAVKPTDDPALLKVTVDGVRTRVGSRLRSSFNVAYVKLREGEILQPQGPAVNLPGTARRAYRVNPPSGEFRWIHRRFLSEEAPTTIASVSQEPPTSVSIAQPQADSETPMGSGVVQASHQGELKLKKLSNGNMETFPIPLPGEARVSEPKDSPEPGMPTRTISDLQRQIDQIDLRLTQVITQPVSQWNLRPLKSKLDRIVEASNDASAIKHATEILVRINDFDRLQQRHVELSETPGSASQASHDQVTDGPWQTVPAPPSAPNPTAAIIPPPTLDWAAESGPTADTGPTADAEPNFSGQGWLIPVFTKRRDLPRFALTDDDGAILYFVSPSSGLNLRRYLRTRVGIFGSVTETTSAETPQLVAQRVVVLNRHQR